MRDFLAYAAAKYEAGTPIISDAEFDRLESIYGYDRVGAAVDLSRAIPHAYRMYSLQKCFVGGKRIELPGEVIETPKLDGSAISLFYVNGKFVRGLRRGDGKAGDDITDKVATIVPNELGTDVTIQVTGEVLVDKHIPNARNVASGAFTLKSIDEFKSRGLEFVAYGVAPYLTDTFYEDMGVLETFGFETVTSPDLDRFMQDGRVFRVNNNVDFEELGFTNKHPRGAYALKEVQEGVVTQLEDVIWQVGRSGVVAPVAILKPVKVGDATVSRATLHNIGYIKSLGIEIGCSVEIIRSGEIIPRVVRRVYEDVA